MKSKTPGHLSRLEQEHYRGQAYVHWVMTIANRQTGWLIPAFNYKFRELLTHTSFRYALVCPIYCLMPDHIHMVWIGIDDQTDQQNALRYFRKHIRSPLEKLGFKLQHQPYDYVLRESERKETAFEQLVEYVARNPERKDLVPPDGFRKYKYTGCLVPGYPELNLWESDYWPRFWRVYAFLRSKGLSRVGGENVK